MSTNTFRGPWETFHMYTGQLHIKDKKGFSVCELKAADRETNARLIAAAPELLEALEWLLAAHLNPEHASANGAAERALKIINKTKGN